MRHAFIVILTLIFTGCVTTIKEQPDNKYATDFRGIDTVQKIVILPFAKRYKEFSAGEQAVRKELAGQLQRMGYRVVFLNEASYTYLWDDAVKRVGGLYDVKTGEYSQDAYNRAIKLIADDIAGEVDYSVLVVPNFVFKQATLNEKSARWDGIKREYLVKNRGGYDYTYKGHTTGLSLSLMAFKSDGNWLFNSYGGILLPYYTNWGQGQNELRENLFESQDEIAEGVKLALSPIVKH